MTYREDAEDVENMMTLSDSQSLVDLLRLAVREEHERLTARFSYDMPRQDVTAAVESLWRELCGEEAEAQQTLEAPPPEDQTPQDPEEPVPAEAAGEEEGQTTPEEAPESTETSGEGEAPDAPPVQETPAEPVYPPCPWIVRFYPDKETAELVEVLLETPEEA